MDLKKRLEELQRGANELAIQESNLRERIEPLVTLNRQLDEILAQKRQFLGAITILREMIAMEESAKPDESGNVAAIDRKKKA